MTDEARLSIRNLSVAFGSNLALDSHSLDVKPGEIVALLGANGSGKSTTVKALTGINPIRPGAEIRLGGNKLPAEAMNPVETQQRGIRVVHQEAPLVPDLTVAEAMAVNLGFPTSGGFIRWKRLRDETLRRLTEFDITLDVEQLCKTLSASERALVSLAIALGDIPVESAVLILDEATASLSTAEADRFLKHVRETADRGLAVLMVTHRLPEVRNYADGVVVLREGVRVDDFNRQSFDERAVVRAMVGDDRDHSAASGSAHSPVFAQNALDVDGLVGPGVDDVSFSARSGEILGLAGRPGGGAAEVLRLLGGIELSERGSVTVGGARLSVKAPRQAIGAGMFYISANRLTEGGVLTLSVAENLTLPTVERYGFRQRDAKRDIARIMTELDVRPTDPSVPFGSLSGGNQQKVLLGRWLLLAPRVLLLDDPTVGVDPHTREVMFRTLRALADAGTTVLMRSSEPEQLARLCDRVLVVRDGRITGELTDTHVTTEEISLATFA
jgi:ABC-type sugar transport system ATPase subunit